MEYNVLSHLEYCKEIVVGFQSLLLYSHIPSSVVTLALALFVYYKNKELLLSKILVTISILFWFWAFFDLVIWLGYAHPSLVMFTWMPSELFAVPIFFLCFYFSYVFLYKKDLSPVYKWLFAAPILPVLLTAPTEYNLTAYNLAECIASENPHFTYYTLGLKIAYAFATAILIGIAFFNKDSKKQRVRILILAAGILVFLYAFLVSGYISEITEVYSYEMYGLFGMIVFVGALAYLITKFKEFDVKVLSVHLLVLTLIALVGSQFFFANSTNALIVTIVTFVLSLVFGYYLIRSVQTEVRHREHIELLANQLKKSNSKLLEIDKQKSEFVSFATHQLRAPLTAMKGYTSLILEGDLGELSPEIRDAVSRISDSSKSLANVVDDYLNVSRIELGTMKYNFAPLDVKKLVESILAELKPSIEQSKSVKFTYTADASQTYMASADVDKIKQVFTNLIDNSLKYTPTGYVQVTLGIRDNVIRFMVKDSGVGIAPEIMPKLFSKFTRANNANTVNIHGTGLGLFVARDIVLSHHGKIWAESEGEGKGSTFIVELNTLKV